MTLDHAGRLGSALLFWTGAVLLALYLACNPTAVAWQERLGPARLWGAVLGLVALGLVLAVRSTWVWVLLAASLLAVLLPPWLARWLSPTVALAGLGLATGGLGRRSRRHATPPRARFSRPARRDRPRRGRWARRHAAPGRRSGHTT